MKRIRMPKGHTALSLEGISYRPDEAGAFEVPDQYLPELVRVHGAVLEPSVKDFEEMAEQAELKAANAKVVYEQLLVDASRARQSAVDAATKTKAAIAANKKVEPKAA